MARKKAKHNNIGIDWIEPPSSTCNDPKCPWHGHIKIRGQVLKGIVVSAKPIKTAVVRIDYLHWVPKFERYERRRSKIYAHNPPCINAKEGDLVYVGETRPLSKTKHFVVLQILKRGEEG
ncbi:MAG: 30S ribosomal protein S17 [Candidatus Aenigmarchaeota archaeon ex4484_224]|nr:MAG: 30S ribosomal protein S17 [Candidatus Aenigmarchaeota archaeon ex4484_224]